MMAETKQQLKTKLFIGCPLSTDLAHALHKSLEWEKDRVVRLQDEEPLMTLKKEEVEYFGFFARTSSLTLDEIALAERRIQEHMLRYCPTTHPDKLHVRLFTQEFVG